MHTRAHVCTHIHTQTHTHTTTANDKSAGGVTYAIMLVCVLVKRHRECASKIPCMPFRVVNDRAGLVASGRALHKQGLPHLLQEKKGVCLLASEVC
jgi:hypothetical protein